MFFILKTVGVKWNATSNINMCVSTGCQEHAMFASTGCQEHAMCVFTGCQEHVMFVSTGCQVHVIIVSTSVYLFMFWTNYLMLVNFLLIVSYESFKSPNFKWSQYILRWKYTFDNGPGLARFFNFYHHYVLPSLHWCQCHVILCSKLMMAVITMSEEA